MNDDFISRQAVLDLIEHYNSDGLGTVFIDYEHGEKLDNAVRNLPSATPTERTGHWHIAHGMYEDRFWCDCGFVKIIDNSMKDWKYCPKCGCRMDEPQESEVKQ